MVEVGSSALWASLRLRCELAPRTEPGLGAWERLPGWWGNEEPSPASVGRSPWASQEPGRHLKD